MCEYFPRFAYFGDSAQRMGWLHPQKKTNSWIPKNDGPWKSCFRRFLYGHVWYLC